MVNWSPVIYWKEPRGTQEYCPIPEAQLSATEHEQGPAELSPPCNSKRWARMAFLTPWEMVELPACSDRCWVPMTSALGRANHRGTPSPGDRPLPKQDDVDGTRQLTSLLRLLWGVGEMRSLLLTRRFCTSFLLRISIRQARGSAREKQEPREGCDPVGKWEPRGTQTGQSTQSSGFSCFLQNRNQSRSPAGSEEQSSSCRDA